jgi:hypothetical protein
MEEERADDEMLRQYLTTTTKSWARRGSEIGKNFTLLMLGCEMRPRNLIL